MIILNIDKGGTNMFSIFGAKKNSKLESICARIDSNVANNYKDAAQEALKEYEETLKQIELSPKQRTMYQDRLATYKETMKGFTHKDQKPYWDK